jgi:hypothetical protein
MIKYFVRPVNSLYEGWNEEFDNIHDARIAVQTIKKVNKCLDNKSKFHGFVTLWKGYCLGDGTYVTESAEPVKDLDF